MCANYEPIREIQRIRADLQALFVDLPAWQPETWPQYLAPFIRRAPDVAQHQLDARLGQFGLMPYWNRDAASISNSWLRALGLFGDVERHAVVRVFISRHIDLSINRKSPPTRMPIPRNRLPELAGHLAG